jgi:hypothetical protein
MISLASVLETDLFFPELTPRQPTSILALMSSQHYLSHLNIAYPFCTQRWKPNLRHLFTSQSVADLSSKSLSLVKAGLGDVGLIVVSFFGLDLSECLLMCLERIRATRDHTRGLPR